MSNDRYRVRDKNDDKKGTKGKVWGENLTMTEALKLKEQVTGSRKSTTARLELMSVANVPVPQITDSYIVAAKKAATSAAAGPAAEAQRRADAHQAKQKLVGLVKTIVAPVVPDFDEGDLEGTDLDPDELEALLGDDAPPTAEDIEHARLAAESEAKATDGEQQPH